MTLMPRAFWRAQFAARSSAAVDNNVFSSILPAQKLSSAVFNSRRGPMRGVPSVATVRAVELDEFDMASTPKYENNARRGKGARMPIEARTPPALRPPDTPPVETSRHNKTPGKQDTAHIRLPKAKCF